MKIWIVEGEHHSVPGRIVKVCASKVLADLEAVVMVNLIRKDLGFEPDCTADDWEDKLEEVKTDAADLYNEMPDVEVSEHEVIGS